MSLKTTRRIRNENDKKQKYLDALVDTKREFIITCIWGIVWTCILGSYIEKSALRIVFFFIPFGWKLLTYLQSFIPISIIGSIFFWIAWIFVKGSLSIVIGIPAFVFQLIKTFWVHKEIKHTRDGIVPIASDDEDDIDSLL